MHPLGPHPILSRQGKQLKELLQKDPFAKTIRIVDDLSDPRFVMGSHSRLKFSRRSDQQDGHENQQRQQNIFEQNNELQSTEMKLKDAQMRRLQEKVRSFMSKEQKLSERLEQVESKDQSLMDKLEQALSFGKVLFLLKPVKSKTQKSLQSQLHKAYKTELEAQKLEFARIRAKQEQEMGWGTEEIQPIVEADVLDLVLKEALEDEFEEISRFVMADNIFAKNIQIVFALLTRTSF